MTTLLPSRLLDFEPMDQGRASNCVDSGEFVAFFGIKTPAARRFCSLPPTDFCESGGSLATKRVDFGGRKSLFTDDHFTGNLAMECFNLIAAVAVSIASLTPPFALDDKQVLKRCKEVKIQLLGRDPCAGSGFCCALLPVNCPQDVGSVNVPRNGFDLDDLRLLKCFTNLSQVRSRWSLTEAEDRVVRQSVPKGTALYYHVRMADGSLKKRRSIRSGYPPPTEDVNGDGLVNEDDEFFGE